MLVGEIMTRQVVAIAPDTPIRDVQLLMEQRNIRHFPILDQGTEGRKPGSSDRLVGIVSDRDLRSVGADHPRAPKGVRATDPVSALMASPVVTVGPREPIENAAKTLSEQKIGAMPVMQDGKLVGILTATDLLHALVKMSGVNDSASRLEVEVVNRPGALAGLLDRVASRNLNVSSVMTSRSDADTVTFVLRVGTPDGAEIAAHLRELGYTVLWPAGAA